MKLETKKLGHICKTTSGGTPSRNNPAFYGGHIPWIKSGELRDGIIAPAEEYITDRAIKNSSAKLFPAGTLLIAMYGATVGKLGILPFDAATNQAICAIFTSNEIDRDFLFYYLLYQRNNLIDQGTGGAQPNISQSIIRDIPVPLPPLDEQKRIATILEEADHARRTRRFTQSVIDTLMQEVFVEMFGDPVTNPMGWRLKKLSKIGTLDRGRSRHRPRNAPELLGGEYPLIQTGDVSNADRYIRSYEQTYSELGLQQSKMWDAGTMCITIAANIAKTAILTFDACFPDSVVGFLPQYDFDTEYILQWFTFVQENLERVAPESAQKNINLAILRDLDVPFPPRDLRLEFAQVAWDYENTKVQQHESARQAEHLFQTLLHRAFRGEL